MSTKPKIASPPRLYLHLVEDETKQFAERTTYHGLVRIYNSTTWPSRIFWCVVVVSCLSLFMIHSGILLWGYHQRPTLTQINVVSPTDGVPFPEVTICNANPVVISKVAAWNMTDRTFEYLLKFYSNSDVFFDSHNDDDQLRIEHDDYERYLEYYQNSTGKVFNAANFYESVGYTCNDMILSCRWAGQEMPNCCRYAQSVMTDVGKCIKLSHFGTELQKIAGAHYGLQLLIDSRIAERHNYFRETNAEHALKLFVHSPGIYPFLQNAVIVPIGTTVYGAIRLRNSTLLPLDDWGFCVSKWNHTGQSLMSRLTYTAAHCEIGCRAREYLTKCGCLPLSKHPLIVGDNLTIDICTPLDISQCDIDRSTSNDSDVNECKCYVECRRLEYNMMVSYTNINADSSELQRRYRRDADYIRDNFVGIAVYMKEIAYEHREQMKQMQTADLLSNIAGGMGLFLGMSTVTLLEVFIYLFKSIFGIWSQDRHRQFAQHVINAGRNAAANLIVIDQQSTNDIFIANDTDKQLIASNTDRSMGNLYQRRYSRRPTTIVIERRPSVAVGTTINTR